MDSYMQENELQHLPHSIHKKNSSKYVIELYLRAKTNFFQYQRIYDIGEKLHDPGVGQELSDLTPKA